MYDGCRLLQEKLDAHEQVGNLSTNHGTMASDSSLGQQSSLSEVKVQLGHSLSPLAVSHERSLSC